MTHHSEHKFTYSKKRISLWLWHRYQKGNMTLKRMRDTLALIQPSGEEEEIEPEREAAAVPSVVKRAISTFNAPVVHVHRGYKDNDEAPF
jgi:hypothetical protein